MKKSSVAPHLPVALPPLVADYVEGTNISHLERLIIGKMKGRLYRPTRNYGGKTSPAICVK
jgi:hypothetical protein